MQTMNKIWVVEPHANYDVSRAEQFGELRYCFERNSRRSSIWAPEFRAELAATLECFDPVRDYFVLSGHMVPLMIAVASLTSRYGHIRGLGFHAADREYVPVMLGELTLGEPADGSESTITVRTRPGIAQRDLFADQAVERGSARAQ